MPTIDQPRTIKSTQPYAHPQNVTEADILRAVGNATPPPGVDTAAVSRAVSYTLWLERGRGDKSVPIVNGQPEWIATEVYGQHVSSTSRKAFEAAVQWVTAARPIRYPITPKLKDLLVEASKAASSEGQFADFVIYRCRELHEALKKDAAIPNKHITSHVAIVRLMCAAEACAALEELRKQGGPLGEQGSAAFRTVRDFLKTTIINHAAEVIAKN